VLVTVEADEFPVLRHVHAAAIVAFQGFVAAIEPVVEHVGHGDQLQRPAFGG
jgi:hypothetical protein